MDAEYPRTLKEVRDGGIDKVLNLLGHVDVSEIKDKKKNFKTLDFWHFSVVYIGENWRRYRELFARYKQQDEEDYK